jgi:hypothetical protein
VLPFSELRLERITFFVCNISEATVRHLTVKEGAGLALFHAQEIVRQPKVIPWDLAALLMHARRDSLFRAPSPEPKPSVR